jgi:hypothetical protein
MPGWMCIPLAIQSTPPSLAMTSITSWMSMAAYQSILCRLQETLPSKNREFSVILPGAGAPYPPDGKRRKEQNSSPVNMCKIRIVRDGPAKGMMKTGYCRYHQLALWMSCHPYIRIALQNQEASSRNFACTQGKRALSFAP